MLDLCLTTTPEIVSASGVIRSGISDHDIAYMVRKLNHFRINRHRTTQKRCLKHFKQELFINDLESVKFVEESARLCRPIYTLISIYNALILPHLEYACVVWDGLDKGLAIKLQRPQNRAARIITRSS